VGDPLSIHPLLPFFSKEGLNDNEREYSRGDGEQKSICMVLVFKSLLFSVAYSFKNISSETEWVGKQ